MVEIYNTPRRRWQNLIYRKCIDCNAKLIENKNGQGYECPDCDFFIFKNKLAEILTDETHVAVRFMNPKEKKIIKNVLKEMGVVEKTKIVDNEWRQTKECDKKVVENLVKIGEYAEKFGFCWEIHNETIMIRKCQYI